ncbi:unnamed protein product [Nezara viridula]|uniref:Uncharacterized protein n=1 Tax=Nezara viridula TaxID=85310 RepID=A0A9P0HM57_NEZVI|nr:unnamed protein product [Nezara viridula]
MITSFDKHVDQNISETKNRTSIICWSEMYHAYVPPGSINES